MRFRYQMLLTVLLIASNGCSSMSSTMLSRDESNVSWNRHTHLDGVPITLKVPTHLKVYIFERHYLVSKVVGDGDREDATIESVERLKLPFVIRDFDHELVYTEKIFTVDFKRPAVGMFNLRLDMTDDQYIDQLQHDITDKTIEQTKEVLGSFAPQGLAAAGPAGTVDSDAINKATQEITSVVAVGLFQMDDPDFEVKLASFLNCHLNQSHDAFSVPSNVHEIVRQRSSGFSGDGNMCNGPVPVQFPPIEVEVVEQQPTTGGAENQGAATAPPFRGPSQNQFPTSTGVGR